MNQQALEEAIERMGVWVTKHPSGTLTVRQGGELFYIFPHEKRWTYRVHRVQETNAYQSGFYTRKDVQNLVHKVLTWSWANGAQGGLYRG